MQRTSAVEVQGHKTFLFHTALTDDEGEVRQVKIKCQIKTKGQRWNNRNFNL